ncbi:hypothetical protein AMAG_04535 [Allomyces macrogynus ATCC 38327]|uniref:N-acetyltransferase domain-containing protein n=1 Tax=Allomyces macrogynus (strain ATCC 38327) TaxID=578462 RepID=A0A0L0S5E1_ALLM3|nr:hypothetical protein AMAG_04535 [Allomyces macrogynus ATCC 38327]|eukprot:KNE57675.1 hypothetical protein AMAG_04535 [Allomyces macrogynus ATCC 38327]
MTDPSTRYVLTPLAEATDVDRAELATLLTATFQDDAVWTAFQPTPTETRHALVHLILSERLALIAPYTFAIRSRATNAVVGSVALTPPHAGTNTAPNAEAQAKLDAFVSIIGEDTILRLTTLMSSVGAIAATVVDGAAWTLESVCVAPELRGKGVGTWAVQEVLEKEAPKGAVVLLNTQEESNVRWYAGRCGFRLVDERVVQLEEDEGRAFTNWVMVREIADVVAKAP